MRKIKYSNILDMDKKYKAIKTLKELDLSARPSTASTMYSGKSFFSTESKEEAFNKAYAKDFSITPPKTPPKKPKKLSPLLQKPKSPPLQLEEPLQKPKKLLPLKTKHPLDPDDPIKPTLKTPIIEDHPALKTEIPRISFPKKQNKFSFDDPTDIDDEWLFIKNKNTPTDLKYKKKQLKLQFEDFSPGAYVANEVVGDPFGKYDDPQRLLKAKPLIDERLKRFLGRNDPNVPAKYSGIGDTTAGYNQDYFNLSAPSSPAKPLTPLTPPSETKKRGRPLGSKNKPKT